MARRNIQKKKKGVEHDRGVGQTQWERPRRQRCKRSPLSCPVSETCLERWVGTPSHTLNIPSWFLLLQLFHSRNKIAKTWLPEPHRAGSYTERCWAWWPVISTLGKQRQENCPEFTGSLDYRVRLLSQEYKTTLRKRSRFPQSTSGFTPWSLHPLDPIPSVHFQHTKKPKDQLQVSQSTASRTASEAGSDV